MNPTGQDDGQQGFNDFMSLAQLGTQTFLANQAITSPRASTYAVNSQGQVVATGGGASAPAGGLGSSWLWILLLLLLLFGMFGHR